MTKRRKTFTKEGRDLQRNARQTFNKSRKERLVIIRYEMVDTAYIYINRGTMKKILKFSFALNSISNT